MTSVHQAVVDLEEQNKPGALCTIVRSQGSTPRNTSSKMLVYPGGDIIGTIGGGEMEKRVVNEAQKVIDERKAKLLSYQFSDPSRGDPGVCGGQVEIFVEPILPKPTLLVIGSGHVGKAVAHLADWLGFYVVINDDRPEFCNPESVPEGKLFFPVTIQELVNEFEINSWTYIVMTTRGVTVDEAGLPALLATPAAYIGVIGSQRRWQTTRKSLLEAGIDEEMLNKVYSPIGLELNVEKPEEIAVSIMAEVLMVYYGGTGQLMSGKTLHAERK